VFFGEDLAKFLREPLHPCLVTDAEKEGHWFLNIVKNTLQELLKAWK